MEYAMAFMYLCIGLAALAVGLHYLALAVVIGDQLKPGQADCGEGKKHDSLDVWALKTEIEQLTAKVTGETAEKVKASIAMFGDNLPQLQRIRDKLKNQLAAQAAM